MALELLNCAIAHLSAQPGASIVQHVSRPPASTRDFDAWEKVCRRFTLFARYFLHLSIILKSITRVFSHCEQEHSPLTLPADLKSLYAFSDGMLVRWHVKYGGLFCDIHGYMTGMVLI